MAQPSFLGIDKTQWEFINSFSDWLSAIGTIAAVWVSLYLARKAWRPRAKVSAGHRLVLIPGAQSPPEEIIVLRFVNTGERTIRVTQLGWRTGLFRRRVAIQLFDRPQSSSLPVELEHGQEAHWVVPLNFRDEPWLDRFASDLLSPNRWLSCKTLRAQFFTSVGDVFETKPEANLLVLLRAAGKKG